MPASSMSIATVNSRTRMLRMPIACGDSSVSGIRNVVSSTSHSEMPSTPRWKWMPSGSIQTLSTCSWKPDCAASKSPRMNSDTRKVMSAVPKPRPRWIASSSRGINITSAAPAIGSNVIQARMPITAPPPGA